MEDIYKQELIRKFLDEELQGEEIVIFQNLFKDDPDFSKEVKIAMDTIVSLKTAAVVHHKQLSGGYAHYQRRRVTMLAAAAIVVLVGLGGGYFYINRPISPQEIFDSYYHKPEGSMALGTNNQFNSNQQDTATASIVQLFNMAIENIEKKDYQNAINALGEILTRKPNPYIDRAEFNLALCYLQTNQMELAHQQLMMIAASESSFNIKAEEILNKWQRIRK
jgi:TolA-binding protein